jgi:translocation and assembly module TamA
LLSHALFLHAWMLCELRLPGLALRRLVSAGVLLPALLLVRPAGAETIPEPVPLPPPAPVPALPPPTLPAVQLAPLPLDDPGQDVPDPTDGAGGATDSRGEQALVTWRLRVDAPDDLAKLLLRYLDLARYQRISRAEPVTRGELQRLRASTPAQVRALLETQGYFDSQVVVNLQPVVAPLRTELALLTDVLRGRSFTRPERSDTPEPAAAAAPDAAGDGATAPGDAADDPQADIEVRVSVTPGPRTQIRQVRIEIEGALQRLAAQAGAAAGSGTDGSGRDPHDRRLANNTTAQATAPERVDAGEPNAAADASPAEVAQALIERVRSRWSLPPGTTYTQAAWSDAKAAAVASLRAEGYAAASLSGSLARVDAEQHAADLLLVLDSGPLYRYGELRFEGLEHVDEAAPRALLTFHTGEPLREQPVLDYQDRMSKSGLFDTIAVNIDPPPAPPDDGSDASASQQLSVPVVVRLRERALHQLTLGAGYSDVTGPRVTLEHLHQAIFGLQWQGKTKLQLGRDLNSASLELTSHPQPGPYRNLASVSLEDSTASTLRVLTQKVRLGRSRDGDRIERLYYVEYLQASTTPSGGGISDDNSSLAYTYQWIWRDLDNPVLPTRGLALSADTSVGHTFHTASDSDWFGRATGRLTGYWQLGDAWYTQGRIQLGQVFARPNVSVPFTLLFRAGGDESVRGYAYQSLGPTDTSGTAVGGRVLATSSLELARPFSARTPSLWGAAFIDAGNAAPGWQQFHPAIGWGVGLRWRSPVGPLRIDLAYGEQVRRVRLHFSVGITF